MELKKLTPDELARLLDKLDSHRITVMVHNEEEAIAMYGDLCQLRTHIAALQTSEAGWRELCVLLCGPMKMRDSDGTITEFDWDEGTCGGSDTCHYCGIRRREDQDYYSLCDDPACPAVIARKKQEATK